MAEWVADKKQPTFWSEALDVEGQCQVWEEKHLQKSRLEKLTSEGHSQWASWAKSHLCLRRIPQTPSAEPPSSLLGLRESQPRPLVSWGGNTFSW